MKCHFPHAFACLHLIHMYTHTYPDESHCFVGVCSYYVQNQMHWSGGTRDGGVITTTYSTCMWLLVMTGGDGKWRPGWRRGVGEPRYVGNREIYVNGLWRCVHRRGKASDIELKHFWKCCGGGAEEKQLVIVSVQRWDKAYMLVVGHCTFWPVK